MTQEYKETILGYVLLTGKCTVCESPAVVIRIHSHRQYRNPRIVSGGQSHDYCAAHTPIDIEAECALWRQILTTPPGAQRG